MQCCLRLLCPHSGYCKGFAQLQFYSFDRELLNSAFMFLHGSCWFHVQLSAVLHRIRKSWWDKAPQRTHALAWSSWMCRGEAVPSRQELAWESRGEQGGARWRPLQIWLLLKVLWSAHVYPLAQRWYSGLCGAWDKGPGLFEVKLIPQTMLVVIAPSLFFDTPRPHPLFFFLEKWDLEDADGELLMWLYAFFPPGLLSDPSQTTLRYPELTEFLGVFVHFSEK